MRSKHQSISAILSLSAASVCTVLLSPGLAATRTWDGGAGAGNNYYDINTNWSGDVVPLATDSIVFSLPGTTTVLYDNITGNRTAATLDVSAGNVSFQSFTGTGPFTQTITGQVSVFNNTTFRIFNHNLATQSFFDINNGGTLVADSTGVINAFNMTAGFSGTGTVNVINGGRINVSQSPILGEQNAAIGNMTVSNANSMFMVTKNLILGASGTTGKGTFTTSDSGRVGVGTSGVATAFAGAFTIGDADLTGATGGNVLVRNGSVFNHNTGGLVQMSGNANRHSRLLVDGANSALNSVGGIQVGLQGKALLEVTNGGLVKTDADLTVGAFGTANGTVTVGGGGSILTVGENVLLSPSGGVANMTIASGGRLNIGDGAAAVTHSPNYSMVDDNSPNTSAGGILFVQNGSTVTNSSNGMIVGATSGHSGRVVVSGTSSVIDDGFTYIGFFGSGTLNISAGGKYNSAGAQFGFNGGTATLTVDGAGSTFKSTSNVSLGSSSFGGAGTVTTTNGGTLLVGDAAFLSAGTDVMVTDASPIGTDGGVLSILNGSKLTTGQNAFLGVFTGQAGRAIVSGTGSEWTGANELKLGNGGDTGSRGELQIDNAGRALAANVFTNGTNSAITVSSTGRLESSFQVVLSEFSGTTSTTTVTGTNSTIAVGTQLEIGRSGTGTLNIQSAGKVTAPNATLGTGATGIGTINLSNAASTLDVDGDLTVGLNGLGTVNLNPGAAVLVGDAATGTAELIVADSDLAGNAGGNVVMNNNSTWIMNDVVRIGNAANKYGKIAVNSGSTFSTNSATFVGDLGGTGVLNVTGGGKFTLQATVAGTFLAIGANGSHGSVTIDGANSAIVARNDVLMFNGSTLTTTNGGGFTVGDNAAGFASNVVSIGDNDAFASNAGGKLSISSGSVVTHTGDVVLAPLAGTFGSVVINGAGSRFTDNGNFFTPRGTGRLDIQAGGKLDAGFVVLSEFSTANSTVTVTGTNSSLAAGATLEVSRSGPATLTIGTGGIVTASNVIVGTNAGSNGTISLSDAASRLTVTNTLAVGSAGTGSVNLSGGTLTAATITRGASSTFGFTGGTLVAHTFTGQLTQNGGTNSPGDVGVRDTMNVSGGYTLNSGALAADLFATNNDVLTSNGPVSLAGGSLTLNNVSFPTTLGTSRILIDAPSRTGVFSSVSGLTLSPTRFVAVTYTPNGVILKIARPGDANVDGNVNFDDLLTLAQNYSETTTGRIWVTADFTGNGITNFDDLLLLAQNYEASGLVLPTDLGEGFSSAFAADWTMALSLAPEPGSISLLACAGVLLRRRPTASHRAR